MKINPKYGIDKFVFGMKQKDVIAVYGEPDKNYKDEDENLIFLYNEHKIRLTFYQEEDFRLGYLVASSPDLEYDGHKIIGRTINELKSDLVQNGISKFTKDEFDTYENFFNEEYWMILQSEFDTVVKFELGAIINDKDEFDWKF